MKKNAIVSLVRGYTDKINYNSLIDRNKSIFEHINRKKEEKYELIIFNEGNISYEHQKYILQNSEEQPIKFVDISNSWIGGYEGMCRFYSYDIWNYCSSYDYILRIDEDCILKKCENDPFLNVKNNVCLKSVFWGENHPATCATLPIFIENLLNIPSQNFWNDKFPYTNVFLSSVKFWLDIEMNNILKKIALSENQKNNRWGDLPILGCLLNIFAKDKIGTLYGVEYSHTSHNVHIECK
jgi:hypothetical protein